MKKNNFSKKRSRLLMKLNKPKLTKDQQQDLEIKRLKKQIRSVAPQVKSTYSESTLTPENAWTAFGLPYPAKGGSVNQRLNERIKIKSINWRWTLSVSETDDFDTMRVVIVQFMDGNAHDNFPLNYQSNLWESPVTDYPVQSPYNTQSAGTYRVLFDKVYNLNAAGKAQISENFLLLPSKMAITDLKFDTDDGGALAGLDKGIIIGFVCSDSTAIPNPKMEVTTKVNFCDA